MPGWAGPTAVVVLRQQLQTGEETFRATITGTIMDLQPCLALAFPVLPAARTAQHES